MSDSPRTDALEAEQQALRVQTGVKLSRDLRETQALARQLEFELKAAEAERDEMKERCAKVCDARAAAYANLIWIAPERLQAQKSAELCATEIRALKHSKPEGKA